MKEIIIIDGDPVSAKASPPVDIGDRDRYSVHAIFTGSGVVGVLKIQGSLYVDQGFVDIEGSSVALTDCDYLYNVANAGYRYFKVIWTPNASASATMEVKAIIKELSVKEG